MFVIREMTDVTGEEGHLREVEVMTQGDTEEEEMKIEIGEEAETTDHIDTGTAQETEEGETAGREVLITEEVHTALILRAIY